MVITFLSEKRRIEVGGRRRGIDLLRKLDLIPGTVMIIRNSQLLTDLDFLEDSDETEIRNVISGGV